MTKAQKIAVQDEKKQRKLSRIQDICLEASHKLPDQADIIKEFTHLFYLNVPVESLIDNPTQQLAGAACSMWKFIQDRPSPDARVNIYNPTVEENGWTSGHTVIEILNADMPFLVDSISAELTQLQIGMHLLVHPIFHTERDADGKLAEFKDVRSINRAMSTSGAFESFIQIHVDRQHSEEGREQIKKNLEIVLSDARAAVEDWLPMERFVKEIIGDIQKKAFYIQSDVHEGIDFLNWLIADHFTFLGFREYDYEFKGGKPSKIKNTDHGYGILRNPQSSLFDYLHTPCAMPEESRAFYDDQQHIIQIKKANKKSTVHRRIHLDTVVIKKIDDKGKTIGEYHLCGLLTSAAHHQNPAEIPLLRQKVKQTFLRASFDFHSHDGKSLLHILNTLPHDELFQMSEDQLYDTALGILEVRDRPQIALFLRPDPFERYISTFLYIPKDRHNSELRKKLQKILEKSFNATTSAFYTQVSEEMLARVHFIFSTSPGKVPEYNANEIEKELIAASQTWQENLQATLLKNRNELTALSLFQEFKNAFSNNYQDSFSPAQAIVDIKYILNVLTEQRIGVNLYQLEDRKNAVGLKLYNYNSPIVLSDVLPMIESLGLRAVSEHPYKINAMDNELSVWIHDFDLENKFEKLEDFDRLKRIFEAAFKKIWEGRIERDNFNKLVTAAGLTWREIIIFRAYSHYLKQLGIPYGQSFMEDVFCTHIAITQKIVKFFTTRFSPELDEKEREKSETIRKDILKDIDGITNASEDRVIRLFLNVVTSTIRTNYFQKSRKQKYKNYVAFKINSAAVEEMPDPRPMFEIFVYSPNVQGIHLRGGKVARGGLRWSDRSEDFRTEILGLMKAQMVKNAVIVPVGSKGGFVVKAHNPTPEEVQKCYKTYISAMLDITDNYVGSEIVPPVEVVRYDEDDPYLVVAADKGTATFSDLANSISLDYNFWLGDAFASGGSQGYDHKKMGITAKGAWESVKRHFRELGKDIQSEPFTAIGVGDMGGDVFGNGMLLSKATKLVAAFNHMHIFIDPDPDIEKSYKERKRLFKLPRSSWADYDKKVMSKGGGIFERSKKSIEITPEIKELLDIKEDKLTPQKLIQAILKSPVELLWFGGIGTYIKASYEHNNDAGDRANDPLRINAKDLRCKVIGEGANLGSTQSGRIEYALQGGKVNTDSIDNAGGVNCSDHEVNIKILFKPLVDEGKITEEERNALLVDMTENVSDLVIRDNYIQTLAITLIESKGSSVLNQQAKVIQYLEKHNNLDIDLEKLPDFEEMKERRTREQGLTRPEISILLSHSKMAVYDKMIEADFDGPDFDQILLEYFPKLMQQQFKNEILTHRLRKEILATVLTNNIINEMGIAFPFDIAEKVGCSYGEIAKAYLITRNIFGLEKIWHDIEKLGQRLLFKPKIALLQRLQRFTERVVTWLLRHCELPLDITLNQKFFTPGVHEIRKSLDTLLDQTDLDNIEHLVNEFVEDGIDRPLAKKVLALSPLTSACDIIRIAHYANLPVKDTATVYYTAGKRFEFNWMRHHLRDLKTDNPWQKNAIHCLIDDLFVQQAVLVTDMLNNAEFVGKETLEIWLENHQDDVNVLDDLIRGLKTSPVLDLSMFVVASNQIRSLIRT